MIDVSGGFSLHFSYFFGGLCTGIRVPNSGWSSTGIFTWGLDHYAIFLAAPNYFMSGLLILLAEAADRSYRIGQKRDVDVVKLITKETIEVSAALPAPLHLY